MEASFPAAEFLDGLFTHAPELAAADVPEPAAVDLAAEAILEPAPVDVATLTPLAAPGDGLAKWEHPPDAHGRMILERAAVAKADMWWADPEAMAQLGAPCPTCNGLAFWWDAAGGRHCQKCQAAGLERGEALAKRAARLRERSPAVPSGGDGPEGKPEAADWPAALADFALLLAPGDLPTPFTLRPGVVVIDPALFLGRLRADILRGSAGPRARWGAVQGDLRRLRAVLIGEGVDRR